MAQPFIAFISDLHLSGDRPYFQFNWEMLLAEFEKRQPDLVLVGGDLSLDGLCNLSDLTFVRRQLDRLPCPWRAVPGNHDIGDRIDKRKPSFEDVTQARRNNYLHAIGSDFWLHDYGEWRIVGINSMIMGSDLSAEKDQAEFLSRAIREANGRPVALLSHLAVCDKSISEIDATGWFMWPASRELLAPYLSSGSIQLMLCGDMHQSRDRMVENVRHVWAPSTAFVTDIAEEWRPRFDARKRVGWIELTLGNKAEVTIHEPNEMVNFDIGGWVKDGPSMLYAFTRRSDYFGFSIVEDKELLVDPSEQGADREGDNSR